MATKDSYLPDTVHRKKTTGERLNNPGNLRQAYPSRNFHQYRYLETGYKALCDDLSEKYDLMTPDEMIAKRVNDLGPLSPIDYQNAVKANQEYVNQIVKHLKNKGIQFDNSTPLDLTNSEVLKEMTIAVTTLEQGKVLGDEKTIDKAVKSSLNDRHEKEMSEAKVQEQLKGIPMVKGKFDHISNDMPFPSRPALLQKISQSSQGVVNQTTSDIENALNNQQDISAGKGRE